MTGRTETLYHGTTRGDWAPYVGASVTPDRELAEEYAGDDGVVIELELDMTGLAEIELTDAASQEIWHNDYAGLDEIRAVAEADGRGDLSSRGRWDVISYGDMGPDGSLVEGDCWRLMTPAAVEATTIVGALS